MLHGVHRIGFTVYPVYHYLGFQVYNRFKDKGEQLVRVAQISPVSIFKSLQISYRPPMSKMFSTIQQQLSVLNDFLYKFFEPEFFQND